MLSSLDRIYEAVHGTPWAIIPAKLETIIRILDDYRAGGVIFRGGPASSGTSAEVEALVAELEEKRAAHHLARDRAAGQSVAVIPIIGTISHRIATTNAASGGISAEAVDKVLRQTAADSSIGAIVLDIDSPGGAVAGIPELAATVREIREGTPVFAIANSLAASAAYWIASQATEVSVIPSGMVGSIGVLSIHQDRSKANKRAGITTTVIKAGKFKGEGHPFEGLSEEALAALQSQVDTLFGVFVGDVAAGRGVSAGRVRDGFGEGRIVLSGDALAEGMVDHIETLDDVIGRAVARVQGDKSPRSGRLSNARRRIALDRER